MSGRKRTRVLIAEDDASMRAALTTVIESEATLELVAVTANAGEAIAAAIATRPDVAIVDVRMPDGGGARASREITQTCPETKVIVHSADVDRATVIALLEAGAVGYLVKGSSIESIIASIQQAASGRGSLSAEVAGEVIEELVDQLSARRQTESELQVLRERIELAIRDEGAVSIALQPICELSSQAAVGAEALARFSPPPTRSPDRWFAEASETGLRTTLELVAVRRALARLSESAPSSYLSINASPETATTTTLRELLDEAADRMVIEITEHAQVNDYDELRENLAELRSRGVRFAVDDAGAGFASLRHILQLAPDFIKLDQTLIAGIDTDTSKRALATGLISFANAIGATIIAEGIERQQELDALQKLGVRYGQGYLLGRPV